MKFSIIIPTFNNYKYLKLAIDSIKTNSTYDHQIIIHLNGLDNETENYIKLNNLYYTKSSKNLGLCSGVNIASKLAKENYIVYAHDDMYFLPEWDSNFALEIRKINHNKFYLSCTHISSQKPNKSKANSIYYDCGSSIDNFDEKKLLNNYKKLKFYNLQGSHWAPHIIHKELWNRVGGFSEEFNPGFGSDPDLNMKLWKEGVRIFKGLNDSRIYHFGSLTTRKNINIIRNDANLTFLLKWKITIQYFIKYYLKRGSIYDKPLSDYKITTFNFVELIYCKIKYFYSKIKN